MRKEELIKLTKIAREEVDIEKVLAYYKIPMTNVGGNVFVLCPFHNDTHPSASINKTKNRLRCFVEDENYTTIDIVKIQENEDNMLKAINKVLEIGNIKVNVNYNTNLTFKGATPKASNCDLDSREVYDIYSTTLKQYEIDYLYNRGIFLYDNKCRNGYSPIRNILYYNNIEIRHNYYNGDNFIVYKFNYNNTNNMPFWEEQDEDEYFYIAKKTNAKKDDRFKTRNGGTTIPKFIILKDKDFNINEKSNGKPNIYITEGMENALSIVQGKKAHAITLNSVSNVRKFLEILDENPKLKYRYNFIIATDKDNAGEKARMEMEEYFKDNGFSYGAYDVLYNYKDETVNDVNDLWRKRFK